MKILLSCVLVLGLMIGCVSTSPQPTNSIKPEVTLVTALILSEISTSDRAKLAQEVYNAADAAEKLLNDGVKLSDIKVYVVNAIGTGTDAENKKALFGAVLDYIDAKYNVTVGLNDAQKNEIVKSAIDGVKSAVSPYLSR